LTALEALPEQFIIGVANETVQASKATSEIVRALLDRAEGEGRRLWVGWAVPREVAVTHSAVLDDQLEDATLALAPVYKLFAWAADNDLIVLGREVEAAKADRVRVHEDAERDRPAWEARRERERERQRDRDRHVEGPESTSEAQRADRTERVDRAEKSEKTEKRKREIAKPAHRAVARRAPRVTEVDPSAPIEKGTRVQVLAGPFAGKVGVVQELDGKGAARVMLGLLATRLEVKDLIASAEGKDRPALASSHRRPLPVRS